MDKQSALSIRSVKQLPQYENLLKQTRVHYILSKLFLEVQDKKSNDVKSSIEFFGRKKLSGFEMQPEKNPIIS